LFATVITNNVFKNRLDKFCQDQEIISDYKAQLAVVLITSSDLIGP